MSPGRRSSEAYDIYLEVYGKVKSGTKLKDMDYGYMSARGFRRYEGEQLIAVTLASQDVKMDIPIRSKGEFSKEVKRLSE